MKNKNNQKNIIIFITLLLISFFYTILVKYFDVNAIGPNNSAVGFSKLNLYFKNIIGSNMIIYKISEIFGFLLLFLMFIYGCIGLYQLIKRKSIIKVDKQIIILGCFYIVILLVYIFFEKVVINYRPIIIDNELEASYPSSHTMLALCIGISSLIVSKKYFNKKYIKVINIITIALMLIVLIGRIISGVHWISDIIGGIIISFTLISLFKIVYYWKV